MTSTPQQLALHCSIALTLLAATGCPEEPDESRSESTEETSEPDQEASDGVSVVGDAAGRYGMTGVGPTQSLVIRPDGSYELTFHGSPMMAGTETGTVAREGEVLTFSPEGDGRGPMGSRELAVNEHDGRAVLVPPRYAEAFGLSPTWGLGLVRLEEGEEDRPPMRLDASEPRNPAGPDGQSALPPSLTVTVQRPSDGRFLGFTVEPAPTNVSSSGCVVANAGAECPDAQSSTWGPEAWATLNQLWWAAHTRRDCPDSEEVPGGSPRYEITWEGGELEGTLPADLSEATLSDPCFSGAKLAWWLAERFEATLTP